MHLTVLKHILEHIKKQFDKFLLGNAQSFYRPNVHI